MLQLQRFAALPLALALAACATTATKEAPAPAPAASAAGPKVMVTAANPLAVEAGLNVLRQGGSAVDAAVAVQAVLSLVEPQSSGVGGGAFMTFYDAQTKKVVAYNGRETAPAGATETMFLDSSGKPLTYPVAVTSGKATGVPGAVAMLAMAQAQHGKLAWKDLFGDAERLAADGFVVSPRLAGMISSPFPQAGTPDAKAYFTKPDGQRYQAGDVLKNPAYAATVRKIAAEGPKALLEGSIAEAIVAKVHEGPLPGTITLADLKAYKPKVDDAVCRPYRVYVVCVPNAPSSGAALLEALGILSHTDIADRGPTDPQAWFLFAQASRLMYADRDRYFGDPDFTPVPIEGLLEESYVAKRATLIGDVAGPAPAPGTPRGAGTGWTNPNNVGATDGVFATYNPGAFKSGTSGAIVPAFSFSTSDIPAGATITGVTLTIQRRGSNTTGVNDAALTITVNGSTTSNLASATKWPTTVTAATYGGSSNTLSLPSGALERATGNSTVSVSLTATCTANQTASLDSFAIKLNYSVDVVVPGAGAEVSAEATTGLAVTGYAGAVRTEALIAAGSPSSLTVTGFAGSSASSVSVQAGSPDALTATGVAGAVVTNARVQAPQPSEIALTGHVGTVSAVSSVVVEGGPADPLAVTGYAGSAKGSAAVAAGQGLTLQIVGYAGQVSVGAAVSAVSAGTLAVIGFQGSVKTSARVTGATGALEVTGYQAAVDAVVSVSIEAGAPDALAATGFAGEARGGSIIAGGPAAGIEINGFNGAVATSAKIEAGDPGALRATRLAGSVRTGSKIVAGGLEALGVTGYEGASRVGVRVAAAANDDIAITGFAGEVRTNARIEGQRGDLLITGFAGAARSSVRIESLGPNVIRLTGFAGEARENKGPVPALKANTYIVPKDQTVAVMPGDQVIHRSPADSATFVAPADNTTHKLPSDTVIARVA